VLAAARVVDRPAERTSLLATAVAAIDREKAAVPAGWAAATRAETEAAVQAELRVDRSYRSLTAWMMPLATRRARAADVRGLERLVRFVYQRDAVLGARRPDAVNALVAAVEERLDAARRLRLARDRFALRAPVLHQYNLEIRAPIDLFAQLKPGLESVKTLSGSSPAAINQIQRTVSQILNLASTITPPDEVAAAHALFISAAQLAGKAAEIRLEAALAEDMTRAWDASSAAAGALMLYTKARTDLQTLLRLPQLR